MSHCNPTRVARSHCWDQITTQGGEVSGGISLSAGLVFFFRFFFFLGGGAFIVKTRLLSPFFSHRRSQTHFPPQNSTKRGLKHPVEGKKKFWNPSGPEMCSAFDWKHTFCRLQRTGLCSSSAFGSFCRNTFFKKFEQQAQPCWVCHSGAGSSSFFPT